MKTKFFLLTLLILGNINNSFAQTPYWVWAKSASGGSAYGFSITADAAGNSYVTGSFYGSTIIFGNDTLMGNISSDNLFTAKYDSQGNVLWATAPTGANEVYGNSICTDAYGNSYITGYSQGSGIITFDTITLTNLSSLYAMFVVKYDSSGNVVWAKNAVANAENRGNGISADAYGNVYVTGIYDTAMTLGGFNLIPVYGPDIFLAKYDSSGNVIWAKSAGGQGEDYPNAISTDAIGNCYITGNMTYSANPTFFDTIIVTGSTMFVAKYDSSGKAIWAKSNEGSYLSSLYSNSISHDVMGNSYITGYFYGDSASFGNTTLMNANNGGNFSDIFVVKYNSTGNIAWAKQAGTPDYDQGIGISTDGNGNSYALGFFKNFPITFGSTTLFTFGYIDTYVVKYDSSGNVLWAKSAGGNLNDNPGGISINSNGNCFVTGYSGSPVIAFNTITLTNTGGIFVAKIDTANSSTGITAITNNFIGNIYPNPFSDKLNISINNNSPSEIILYDIASRKLLQQKFINSVSLNTEQLAKGIYLYEVRNKDGVIKKGKIVKD